MKLIFFIIISNSSYGLFNALVGRSQRVACESHSLEEIRNLNKMLNWYEGFMKHFDCFSFR